MVKTTQHILTVGVLVIDAILLMFQSFTNALVESAVLFLNQFSGVSILLIVFVSTLVLSAFPIAMPMIAGELNTMYDRETERLRHEYSPTGENLNRLYAKHGFYKVPRFMLASIFIIIPAGLLLFRIAKQLVGTVGSVPINQSNYAVSIIIAGVVYVSYWLSMSNTEWYAMTCYVSLTFVAMLSSALPVAMYMLSMACVRIITVAIITQAKKSYVPRFTNYELTKLADENKKTKNEITSSAHLDIISRMSDEQKKKALWAVNLTFTFYFIFDFLVVFITSLITNTMFSLLPVVITVAIIELIRDKYRTSRN